MASQLRAPIGRAIARSKARPRIRSSGRIMPVLSRRISLTPPQQAIHTIALIPKVERRASVHPTTRTEATTCELSPLRQPRMKSVAKNSSRDIKPLSCLDKLRFSSEVRVVESIARSMVARPPLNQYILRRVERNSMVRIAQSSPRVASLGCHNRTTVV